MVNIARIKIQNKSNTMLQNVCTVQQRQSFENWKKLSSSKQVYMRMQRIKMSQKATKNNVNSFQKYCDHIYV